MEILCVVDKLEGLEQKISLLDVFGAETKFFVKSDIVAGLIKNKKVVTNMVAIYNNNVNVTIDKYLNKEEYTPTDTLIYYASAELTAEMVDNIRQNMVFKPNTIHIKKRLSWWGRFKLWFYNKLVKVLFGETDAFASTKLQYFSAKLMEVYKQAGFKNHIFEIPNTLTVELERGKESSYYVKPKFNKNYLYNPIVFCIILICYVALEKFLQLPFWVYFLVVALLLTTIINLIIMIIKNTLDVRYKK